MIDRYTRSEMGMVWDLENRFQKMLEVETTVAEVQASLKIIPRKAAQEIKSRGKFSIKKIREIENVTKHDVMAFVKNVAENVGDNGKYVHFGMTSSDVLDTAFSLQVREAGLLILKEIALLKKALVAKIKEHKSTLCAGRTHGMSAEPMTFGYKLSSHYAEVLRNEKRVQLALNQFAVCKLSGAVGTYSSQKPEVEMRVAKKLGLKPEVVATQVVPRDRHAELIFSLCMIGTGLERLALELRHLQRSEVSEVTEGFTLGQTGSSAMPHKKNPISSENITGLSRLLRSYLSASLENIPLWHERDISHSSVERVMFPDAFILCDYMLSRMNQLLSNLYVNKKRMKDNIERTQGVLFTSHLLVYLVDKGLSRDEAYKNIQRLSHSLREDEHLMEKILKDPFLSQYFDVKSLKKIFSGDKYVKSIEPLIRKVLALDKTVGSKR